MHSEIEKVKFLQRIFGTCVIGGDRINIAVCCPNPKCGSYGSASKKKLVIRADNDHHHCWVCDIKGRDLRSILKKYFPQYLNEYTQTYLGNHALQSVPISDDEIFEVSVPKGFVLLAANLNSRDPDVKDTIRYVRSRGLSNRDLWYFKFGTCTTGRYRRRVIMPSFDEAGDINYFVARIIDPVEKMKYINAKIPKKNVIFNEINVDWSKELTLVEGPFDLTKCDENATCLLGSSLSHDYALFHKIVKHQTPVLLAMDPDVSKKAHNIAKKLVEYGIDVRMLGLGSFKDVGEMSKLDFITAKKNAKVWHADDRLYDLIGSIRSGSLI
jgi:hypothetical protein